MTIINRFVPGYVIQCFDTEEKRYVSQEFIQSSYDQVEYEDSENGDFTDDSWTQFVPELPIVLVQPQLDAPPLDNRLLWVKWYRKSNEVTLMEAVTAYNKRVDALRSLG